MPLGLTLSAKRTRRPSDYPYHESYRTRWNDNDMFHHLNNPIYAVLIDSIINSYLITKCGYSPPSATQSPMVGLVGNTYCDYFGSASYPGMLDVGLRVVKLGRASVMYECGIFQGEGEEGEKVRAIGGFTQIWVERATNKVTKEGIPAVVRRELEKLWNGDPEEQEEGKAKL